MSIAIKVLIGTLLLGALLIAGLAMIYFSVVLLHEWRWRKLIDENYEERETESEARTSSSEAV